MPASQMKQGHNEPVVTSVYVDTGCSAQLVIDDHEEEAGRDDDDDDEKEIAEKGRRKREKFEKTMKMRMISTARRTSASATTKTVNHKKIQNRRRGNKLSCCPFSVKQEKKKVSL